MRDFNKIILVGRLGTDPVQRETKKGVPVVHFSLATARRLKEDGSHNSSTEEEIKKETQWHRIVAWGKQAENCAQFLKKGNSVLVEGSVRSRVYDAKDGSEKVAFEVHAENVSFLGFPKRREESSEAVGAGALA